MTLVSRHHIDFIAFDITGELNFRLAINHSRTKLLHPGSGVAWPQIKFLGDLQTRRIQTHEIQAFVPAILDDSVRRTMWTGDADWPTDCPYCLTVLGFVNKISEFTRISGH
jgi:hypothetical protein